MSVDLEQLLHADGFPLDSNYPGIRRAVALVSLTVDFLRGRGLAVHHEPLRCNYYHAGVKGITPKDRRALAKACIEEIPVDQALAERYSGGSATVT
jgi:hypothetical protein